MHRLIVTSATYRQSSRADPAAAGRRPRELAALAARTAGGSTARRSATPCSPSRASSTRRWAAPASSPSSPPSSTKLSSKGAAWPVSDHGRGPQPPEPLRLRPAQPPLSLLRGLRPPRHQRELPAPARHHDRPPGAHPPEQPARQRRRAGPWPTASRREAGPDRDAQVDRAYRLVLGRPPDAEERRLAREFLAGR